MSRSRFPASIHKFRVSAGKFPTADSFAIPFMNGSAVHFIYFGLVFNGESPFARLINSQRWQSILEDIYRV